MDQRILSTDFLVVGGGVAGVCIVQELDELLDSGEVADNHRIIFVTGSEGFVKRVANQKQIGQIAMSFDVESSDPNLLFGKSSRVKLIQDDVISWLPDRKSVKTRDGFAIAYRKMAIATGASPNRVVPMHPKVIRLRDLQTVKELQKQLGDARRLLIVGNGGIATELA